MPHFPNTCSITQFWRRIKESSSNGKWRDVFSHYRDMERKGTRLTEPFLFPPILKACLSLSSRHGESVHACLVKQGLESFTSIGNSITDFYMKSRAIDCACCVFASLKSRDSVSWNIMIHGHLDHGALEEGLWLFMQGRIAGFEPNTATLVLVLQACRSLKATHDGLKFHGYAIQSGLSAIVSVQNSLLCLYSDIEMEVAQRLFDEMLDRDLVSWSIMIGGYAQSEETEVALQLFQEIVSQNEIEVDAQMMVSVIKASVQLAKLGIGKLIHGFVIYRGFNSDLFVGNSLVDMYSKCHDVESALEVFGEMPVRNVVSWNSFLSGLVNNENYSEALLLFESMQKFKIKADEVTLVNLLQTCKQFLHSMHCKSIHSTIVRLGHEKNELVINSLIDAYAKCNLITLAWQLFCQTKKRDTVTWSTMISGFTHCGMSNEAISVFQEMIRVQEKPNAITLLNLVEACSVFAEVKRSKSAHGIAIRRGLATDVAIGTAILDMYSKCGSIEMSERVFNHQIPRKNIISWSAMIAAYGMNGLPHDALALLGKMKTHGLKPNSVTILSVLSSCSHGGLIEEGISYFRELVQEPAGVEMRLEHYSCMVDLLARAGKLDSAMELIKKMPTNGLNPGPSAWGAFLSASRSHKGKNFKLGADAVSRILELEPSNSAGYLLASSMYAADGSWVDVAKMRWLVKERGVKMVAGYSLVHVNDNAFRFVAGDKHHPLADEACLVSEQLHLCLKMDKLQYQAVIE